MIDDGWWLMMIWHGWKMIQKNKQLIPSIYSLSFLYHSRFEWLSFCHPNWSVASEFEPSSRPSAIPSCAQTIKGVTPVSSALLTSLRPSMRSFMTASSLSWAAWPWPQGPHGSAFLDKDVDFLRPFVGEWTYMACLFLVKAGANWKKKHLWVAKRHSFHNVSWEVMSLGRWWDIKKHSRLYIASEIRKEWKRIPNHVISSCFIYMFFLFVS